MCDRKIIRSKNVSPSLHWINTTMTGKARSAIRRHWQQKDTDQDGDKKDYNATLWLSLPDIPGKLGEVTSLIGTNQLNISSVEMTEKSSKYINFKFNLIISDLKNFTNLISELKQRDFDFRIIRNKDKKNAFFKKFFSNFKKN